jgi:predicted MFS family arabinose efflux permease
MVDSQIGLIVAIGLLSATGAGACGFSVLIGATAQHIPAERRSFASGFINAGGSMGQFTFAPLDQAVLSAFGWMQAMWMMAMMALATAPLAWFLRGISRPHDTGGATPVTLITCASNWRSPPAIRVTGVCTPDSSPAAFTSLSS